MTERLDKVDYYMKLAEFVKERSTCITKVGAVLTSKDGRVLSTGYNGAISKAPHCIPGGCLKYKNHCVNTVHAEMNCLLFLQHKESDMIIYSTHQPCLNCFKGLLQAGVTRIYYKEPYDDPARELLVKRLYSSGLLIVVEGPTYRGYEFGGT